MFFIPVARAVQELITETDEVGLFRADNEPDQSDGLFMPANGLTGSGGVPPQPDLKPVQNVPTIISPQVFGTAGSINVAGDWTSSDGGAVTFGGLAPAVQGLSISAAGVISWDGSTPESIYQFTYTASDTNGTETSNSVTFEVTSPAATGPTQDVPTVIPGQLVGASGSKDVSGEWTSSGGSISFHSLLPAITGLTIDPFGVIAWDGSTPEGNYSFTYRATDSTGTTTSNTVGFAVVQPSTGPQNDHYNAETARLQANNNLTIGVPFRSAADLAAHGGPLYLERWRHLPVEDCVEQYFPAGVNNTLDSGRQMQVRHDVMGFAAGHTGMGLQVDIWIGPEYNDSALHIPGWTGDYKFIRDDLATAGAALWHHLNWWRSQAHNDFAGIPVVRWDGWFGTVRWPLSPTDPDELHPLWATGPARTNVFIRMRDDNPIANQLDYQWSDDSRMWSFGLGSLTVDDHCQPPDNPFVLRTGVWIRWTTYDYIDGNKRRFKAWAADEDNDPRLVINAKDEGGGAGIDMRSTEPNSSGQTGDQLRQTGLTRLEVNSSTSGVVQPGVPTPDGSMRIRFRNLIRTRNEPPQLGGRPLPVS